VKISAPLGLPAERRLHFEIMPSSSRGASESNPPFSTEGVVIDRPVPPQPETKEAANRGGLISSVSPLSREHLENFPVPAFLRIQRMLGIGIRCGRPSPPLDGYDAIFPSAKA
jgi:hypothetical protein